MASFDFQSLAHQAVVDQPDGILLEAIEDARDALRTLRQQANRHTRTDLSKKWMAAEDLVTRLPAVTPEGVVAKLQHALGGMSRCLATRVRCSAIEDAIALIDAGKVQRRPRRRGLSAG